MDDMRLPYGVDTIVLRMTWPAVARVEDGGRMAKMRPLRGLPTGAGDGRPNRDEAVRDEGGER